jgi:hypothetical protein
MSTEGTRTEVFSAIRKDFSSGSIVTIYTYRVAYFKNYMHLAPSTDWLEVASVFNVSICLLRHCEHGRKLPVVVPSELHHRSCE